MQLTVFFDPPFWVAVLEEERDGVLYAARHVFGAQPSNQQVYDFALTGLDALRAWMFAAGPDAGVPVGSAAARRRNPKRVQRELRREMARQGVTSKAHDAMCRLIEQSQQQRDDHTQADRDAVRDYKHKVRREKARQRHRGR